jgi:hypothetical protein
MIPYIMVEPKQWSEMIQAMEENARLKAEVERLRALSFVTAVPVEQYESLRRAGDLMLKFACANMPYPPYATMAKDWNAAKEGKPSV